MLTTWFAFNQYGLNNMMLAGFMLIAVGVIGKLIQSYRAAQEEERGHSRWMFILSDPNK